MKTSRARKRSYIRRAREREPGATMPYIGNFSPAMLVAAARDVGFTDVELVGMVRRTEGVFLPPGSSAALEQHLKGTRLMLVPA